MTEKDIAEETAGLALNQRHAASIDGGAQRDQPHGVENPGRRDWKHQPDGRVGSRHRRDEEQRPAERGMLEEVGHPAMQRHDAATDEHRDQERQDRPRGVDARRPFPLDQQPAEHEQP